MRTLRYVIAIVFALFSLTLGPDAHAQVIDGFNPLVHLDTSRFMPEPRCDSLHVMPHSRVADVCRGFGWTISKRVVIDPTSRVRWRDIPHCTYDDASQRSCVWDATRQGNHCGRSFWIDARGGFHPALSARRCR